MGFPHVAMARETHLKVLQPRMLSGAYQGRLLALIAKLIAPKRVLEIGTYTGYSALCMASGFLLSFVKKLKVVIQNTSFSPGAMGALS